jgi:hypothetical protein
MEGVSDGKSAWSQENTDHGGLSSAAAARVRIRASAPQLIRVMARTLRASPTALRIATRFLSGASRRPSGGCSGQSSTQASSRIRLPLIRNAVRP